MLKNKIAFFWNFLKDTVSFLKRHTRELFLFFIPVEVILLIINTYFGFFSETSSVTLGIFNFLLSVLLFFTAMFASLLVLSAPYTVSVIDSGSKVFHIKTWYKEIIKKAYDIFLIQAFVGIVNIAWSFVSFVVLGIIFVLPYFFSVFLVRMHLDFGFDIYSFFAKPFVFVPLLLTFFVCFVTLNVFFWVHTWHSVSAYLFEGKKGVDALTTSFLLVSKKRILTFVHIIIMSFVAMVPTVVLVGPFFLSILIDNLNAIILQKILLPGTPIVLPDISSIQILSLNVFETLAVILVIPFVGVYRYKMWLGIKEHVTSFNEVVYTKTRKMIKSLLMIGVLGLVCVIFGFFLLLPFIRLWH